MKASDWINVEDRLPKEDLKVLCIMKSNRQIVSGYLYKQNGKICVATDADFEFEDYGGYEATHWQEIVLPKNEKQ